MDTTKHSTQGKSQSPDDVDLDTSQPALPEYSIQGRETSKTAHGHDKSDVCVSIFPHEIFMPPLIAHQALGRHKLCWAFISQYES